MTTHCVYLDDIPLSPIGERAEVKAPVGGFTIDGN